MKEIALFGGIGILLIITVFNRKQQEKALAQLSDEQRGRFVGQFSKLRMVNLYTLIALLVVYFVLVKTLSNLIDPALMYFVLIFLYMTIVQVLAQKKMGEVDLPADYMTVYRKTNITRWLGMILMFSGFIYFMYG